MHVLDGSRERDLGDSATVLESITADGSEAGWERTHGHHKTIIECSISDALESLIELNRWDEIAELESSFANGGETTREHERSSKLRGIIEGIVTDGLQSGRNSDGSQRIAFGKSGLP